ncbi:MAG: hypothetical protein A4E19_14295 [Nitrospira sp. SG-bin1]|nr:MAG: hypothetical protein A4E19_14295 [Nitrospira sp. SG-bin1]
MIMSVALSRISAIVVRVLPHTISTYWAEPPATFRYPGKLLDRKLVRLVYLDYMDDGSSGEIDWIAKTARRVA